MDTNITIDVTADEHGNAVLNVSAWGEAGLECLADALTGTADPELAGRAWAAKDALALFAAFSRLPHGARTRAGEPIAARIVMGAARAVVLLHNARSDRGEPTPLSAHAQEIARALAEQDADVDEETAVTLGRVAKDYLDVVDTHEVLSLAEAVGM